MPTLTATDADFNDVIAAATADGKPVLIDYWAPWCGPCKQLAPVLDQIAAEHPGYVVVKVDIDASPKQAQAAGVMTVPTLVVLDSSGETSQIFAGPKPKAVLVGALANAQGA